MARSSPGRRTTIVVSVDVRKRSRSMVVPASAAAASTRAHIRSRPSVVGGIDITSPSPWRTARAIARGPNPETYSGMRGVEGHEAGVGHDVAHGADGAAERHVGLAAVEQHPQLLDVALELGDRHRPSAHHAHRRVAGADGAEHPSRRQAVDRGVGGRGHRAGAGAGDGDAGADPDPLGAGGGERHRGVAVRPQHLAVGEPQVASSRAPRPARRTRCRRPCWPRTPRGPCPRPYAPPSAPTNGGRIPQLFAKRHPVVIHAKSSRNDHLAGADGGGDGGRGGVGEGHGERGGEDAEVGGGAGLDAARSAGRVVDGREEEVEGAGGGDALGGAEHGARRRRAVARGGDRRATGWRHRTAHRSRRPRRRPPASSEPQRHRSATSPASTSARYWSPRSATKEGWVTTTRPRSPKRRDQLDRDHRAVLDAVAGARCRPRPTRRGRRQLGAGHAVDGDRPPGPAGRAEPRAPARRSAAAGRRRARTSPARAARSVPAAAGSPGPPVTTTPIGSSRRRRGGRPRPHPRSASCRTRPVTP